MTRRVLGAAIIGATALAPLFATTAAEANSSCPAGYECVDSYYSTAAHTTLVGTLYLFCNGTSSTLGKTSQYIVFSDAKCGG